MVSMKRAPRTDSSWNTCRYLLRSRGGHGVTREHSAPATATPPAYKILHPSQLLPDQKHVHLAKILASAHVTLHTILSGVDGVIYTPHTLGPLKGLGLDIYKATRLARKLHAYSVQYAYKLASTRRALEKTSFNSHQQGDARCLGPRCYETRLSQMRSPTITYLPDSGLAGKAKEGDLQIPEPSTNITLPEISLVIFLINKGSLLVDSLRKSDKGLSRYSFRSREGRGGNREHSGPTTAIPPAFEVRHPSQILPEQRHMWRLNTVKTPGPRSA
eukprot:1156351-Pelagomonas_calceolata.AAC.2